MDVFFEPQRGKTFCIELGYFDTVLEIKEKIQKYHNFPITSQTLIFKGHVLQDDLNIEQCEILHNSHIQLLISPENEPKPHIKTGHDAVLPPPKKIKLTVKLPAKPHLPLEMDPNDTVLHLKEKIHEVEPVAVNRISLLSAAGELPDGRTLRECELNDNSEVSVSMKAGCGGAAGGGRKMMKVMVQTKCGTRKIAVEVNAGENVGELRKELQKMQERMQIELPAEGYFFIYKQNVMDDERSFRWHHVCPGDTIEIFNGSVSGGS